MTVMNLRCDACGTSVMSLRATIGSPGGVRLAYHPGSVSMRDDSGLLCSACWTAVCCWLGRHRAAGHCAVCDQTVARKASLHVRPIDEKRSWQLCAPHAADLLNALITVEPKFDRETFRLPLSGS